MRYCGSCHCKAIVFEFESDEIKNALQCNCSICIRKNAIMSAQYYERSQFTLLAGEDNLSVYHWGDNDVNHYFCKNCGIYPFHDSIYEPGRYRINLGCVDSLSSRDLSVVFFDGKNKL
ncbi:GFA family protein [Aliikangiella marina]|uniref:GFA family protein n=1 Tax=Aliikangiella marina TaxID=1712262 RepID=A0A545T9Q4_9GAMM|nr:GFA family protein [Aliikangiella marina]TQV73951.1 GFA family protein [Aliikangiella marina]